MVANGVNKLENKVFEGCTGLTKLSVGAKYVCESIVSGCTSLKNVTLTSCVEGIGRNAFYGGVDDTVKEITVRRRDMAIDFNALGKNNTIYGYNGSTAETYAKDNNCTFLPLGVMSTDVSGVDMDVKVDMTEEQQKELVDQLASSEGMDPDGANVDLSVTNAEQSLPEQEKQTVDQYAEKKGVSIGQYLDIALSIQSADGDRKAVTQVDIAIRLVLEVPENLREAERVFSVIRMHDGESALLRDLDEDPNTITIETDRFSSYTLVYGEVKEGSTVSGALTAFGDKSAQTHLELLDANGKVVVQKDITGSEYELPDVDAGTYTLRAAKANHVTREYTVTVGDDAVKLDVVLWLCGDVNGDGEIDAKDKRILYNHIANGILNGYELSVGDVDGSGEIDARDKRLLYNHIAGTVSLWEDSAAK